MSWDARARLRLQATDWLSSVTAQQLADRIRDFWIAQGFHGIRTRIEPSALDHCTIWVVRSNIVRGFPPKTLGAAS